MQGKWNVTVATLLEACELARALQGYNTYNTEPTCCGLQVPLLLPPPPAAAPPLQLRFWRSFCGLGLPPTGAACALWSAQWAPGLSWESMWV